ncbi:YesL family protein [Oerskovia sp. M15]
MSAASSAAGTGQGPLSQIASAVYRHLVLGVLLAITCLPTVVAWTALVRDPANLWLFALATLPVAPALSAGLYTVRAWSDDGDVAVARAFWRGLRVNLRDVVAWWLPVLAVAIVLVTNLAFAGDVPGGAALRPVSLVVLGCSGCGAGICSSSRPCSPSAPATPPVSPRWSSSPSGASRWPALPARGRDRVVFLGSEAVLLLFAWAFVALTWTSARPLVLDVTERFTNHD